jgi:hypothetical protein
MTPQKTSTPADTRTPLDTELAKREQLRRRIEIEKAIADLPQRPFDDPAITNSALFIIAAVGLALIVAVLYYAMR